MHFFLLSVSIALVSANQCSDPPTGTGPCGFGGTCDNGEVCVTESPDGTFVCCKKANVVNPTKAPPATAPPTCKDKPNPQTGVNDCPRLAYLCNDTQYKPIMKDECSKTCGYCGNGGPVTSPCEDGINPNTGRSDCPALKYLCQDTTYKPLMKEQCPKTCGYCQ